MAVEQKILYSVSFKTREGESKFGPLDLLWQLIESYEVDIFEVSLHKITEDFLAFIAANQLEVDVKSDFVLMATRLIYYKSKLLLPETDIEDTDILDVLPEELVHQLLEHKKFQMTAEKMNEMALESQLTFNRVPEWDMYEEGLNLFEVDLLNFLKIFQSFLQRKEKEKPISLEAEEIIVEDIIMDLRRLLSEYEKISFFHYIKTFSVSRCIGVFLAVLEMGKLTEVTVFQDAQFNDIMVKKTDKLLPPDEKIEITSVKVDYGH